MKVAYYLNEGRKKNLYCRISDGPERVSFSLGYEIDPKTWNPKKEEGSHEDPYYYTLLGFKRYLIKRYNELKVEELPNVLATLKQEAETFIDGSGIEGIARKLFDDENKDNSVPKYDEFLQAFEKHSGLAKGEYVAQPLDELVLFHTKEGEIYEIDTYEGLTNRIKSYVDRRSYDEIRDMTELHIWSEIYTDAGIKKHKFLPVMLREWEQYWHKTYDKILKEIGKTAHLDAMKEASWRGFQVFMSCYDDTTDVIRLTDDIDDMELYPIAVITMLEIFNADVCYGEYCESEFFGQNDWEKISLDDDEQEDTDDEENDTELYRESPMFFIRPYEG